MASLMSVPRPLHDLSDAPVEEVLGPLVVTGREGQVAGVQDHLAVARRENR